MKHFKIESKTGSVQHLLTTVTVSHQNHNVTNMTVAFRETWLNEEFQCFTVCYLDTSVKTPSRDNKTS